MKLSVQMEGNAKEIAALALELQGRQEITLDSAKIVQANGDTLQGVPEPSCN